MIQGSKSIGHPGAERWIAAEAISAVHLVHRRRMIHAVDLASAEKAKLIGDVGKMRPVVGHVGAALSMLAEAERTLHVVAPATLHRRFLLAFANELLEVEILQLRFWIERVDM